ncbi:MAG: glycosyl hydrolase 53 family protein, partial [Bacteroidales bacterium]|nr:glycosyl hydrolase 53 family protein [Bacteroidales bacterium]
MKTLKLKFAILFSIWIAFNANVKCDVITTVFDRNANNSFAFGADISWLPVMENLGNVWLNSSGTQKDLLDILKEKGINSVRLRVWVNPANGECGKDYVVNLAKRARAKGFRIMIDFHYSDSWADPAKQTKPAAWANHSFTQLLNDVYNHTYDVLNTLKQNGVTAEWVQVGNETRRGMLWPDGHTDNGFGNFTKLVNKGYDAVKAVNSGTKVIVHIDNGHDNSLYRWMFDGLKNNGAKYDVIGMSAYPRWSKLDWQTMITRVIYNVNDMKSRYNKEVMIVESGHYWNEPYVNNNYHAELMKALINSGAKGDFYWEPQYYGSWYEMGAWDPNTRRPTIAMDAFLGLKITQSSGCTPTAITPYIQVNDGSWQGTSSVTVSSGSKVKFGPQPASGGSWSWSGCGTSGSSREQTIYPASSCTATATYWNTCGAQSTQNFYITVSSSSGETYYRLKNRGTGLYLDGMGRTSNGSDVGQYANTTHVNAQWALESTGNYFKLKNRGTGLYLDGMARTTNGEACGQWAGGSSYNQQWERISTSGYYQFKNRATGLFLDGMGRTGNGDACGQWA